MVKAIRIRSTPRNMTNRPLSVAAVAPLRAAAMRRRDSVDRARNPRGLTAFLAQAR